MSINAAGSVDEEWEAKIQKLKSKLYFLSLAHSDITEILPSFMISSLLALDLSYNNLCDTGAETNWFRLQNLQFLDLQGNNLTGIHCLGGVRCLNKLTCLNLRDNSKTFKNYRAAVINLLPSLMCLDYESVSYCEKFRKYMIPYQVTMSNYFIKRRKLNFYIEIKSKIPNMIDQFYNLQQIMFRTQAKSCPVLILQKNLKTMFHMKRLKFIMEKGPEMIRSIQRYQKRYLNFSKLSRFIRFCVNLILKRAKRLVKKCKAFVRYIRKERKVVLFLRKCSLQIAIRSAFMKKLAFKYQIHFEEINPVQLRMGVAISYLGQEDLRKLVIITFTQMLEKCSYLLKDNIHYSAKPFSKAQIQLKETNLQWNSITKQGQNSYTFKRNHLPTSSQRKLNDNSKPFVFELIVSNKEISAIFFYLFVYHKMIAYNCHDPVQLQIYKYGELIVEQRMEQSETAIVNGLMNLQSLPFSFGCDQKTKIVFAPMEFIRYTSAAISIQLFWGRKRTQKLIREQLKVKNYNVCTIMDLFNMAKAAKCIQKTFRMLQDLRKHLLLAKGRQGFQSAMQYGMALIRTDIYEQILEKRLQPKLEFKSQHLGLSKPVQLSKGYTCFEIPGGDQNIETVYQQQFSHEINADQYVHQLLIPHQTKSWMMTSCSSLFYGNDEFKMRGLVQIDVSKQNSIYNATRLQTWIKNKQQPCQFMALMVIGDSQGKTTDEIQVRTIAQGMSGLNPVHTLTKLEQMIQRQNFTLKGQKIDYSCIQEQFLEGLSVEDFDIDSLECISNVLKPILKKHLRNKYKLVKVVKPFNKSNLALKSLLFETTFTDIRKINFSGKSFISKNVQVLTSDEGIFSIKALKLISATVIIQKLIRSLKARMRIEKLKSLFGSRFVSKIVKLQSKDEVTTIFDRVLHRGESVTDEISGIQLIQKIQKEKHIEHKDSVQLIPSYQTQQQSIIPYFSSDQSLIKKQLANAQKFQRAITRQTKIASMARNLELSRLQHDAISEQMKSGLTQSQITVRKLQLKDFATKTLNIQTDSVKDELEQTPKLKIKREKSVEIKVKSSILNSQTVYTNIAQNLIKSILKPKKQ